MSDFGFVHVQVGDIDEPREGVGFDDGDFGPSEIQVGDVGEAAEGEGRQASRADPVQVKVLHFVQAPKSVGLQSRHGGWVGSLSRGIRGRRGVGIFVVDLSSNPQL